MNREKNGYHTSVAPEFYWIFDGISKSHPLYWAYATPSSLSMWHPPVVIAGQEVDIQG